jgi:hypothetical protein
MNARPAPLDVMRDPPFEHQERPKELRVVVGLPHVFAEQGLDTQWIEKATLRNRLWAQARFELGAQLLSQPMCDRRGEPLLWAIEQVHR